MWGEESLFAHVPSFLGVTCTYYSICYTKIADISVYLLKGHTAELYCL